jgi:hypothetical protein
VVPGAGIEPARHFWHGILSLLLKGGDINYLSLFYVPQKLE